MKTRCLYRLGLEKRCQKFLFTLSTHPFLTRCSFYNSSWVIINPQTFKRDDCFKNLTVYFYLVILLGSPKDIHFVFFLRIYRYVIETAIPFDYENACPRQCVCVCYDVCIVRIHHHFLRYSIYLHTYFSPFLYSHSS